jgi:hypothetical protein
VVDTCGHVCDLGGVTKSPYGHQRQFDPIGGLNNHALFIVIAEFCGVYANAYLVNGAVFCHGQRVIAQRGGANSGTKKHGLICLYALCNHANGLGCVMVHKQPRRLALNGQTARQKHNFGVITYYRERVKRYGHTADRAARLAVFGGVNTYLASNQFEHGLPLC